MHIDFWTWFKPQLPGLVLVFGLIGLAALANLLVLGLEGPSFIAAPLISTAICTLAFLFKRRQHADVVAGNFLTISPHGVTQENSLMVIDIPWSRVRANDRFPGLDPYKVRQLGRRRG